MSNSGEVVSVNISREKGTVKEPVQEVQVGLQGIVADAHSGSWHRQVSLLASERIEQFAAQYRVEVNPGDFAENITTKGLALGSIGPLDRVAVGEVLLEVSQIGKKCHGDNCAVFRKTGNCIMPKEGIFARVIRAGTIRPGDSVIHQAKKLKISVITVSDRAFAGEYRDRSGLRVRELLEGFFDSRRWHPEIENEIVPDASDELSKSMQRAVSDQADILIATGGTGVGPRDRTPEAVTRLCDRLVPGIMEAIRVKFATQNPKALLSRSVAGVAGETLVYAIPGSVKAVEEYISEILVTLEHALFMVRGVDVH